METIVDDLRKHNYELMEVIGKGGFSICARVSSIKYKLEFVCKVISCESPDKAKISYTAETETMKFVHSPYVVNLYEHFVEERNYYLILEFCEQKSLDVLIGNGQTIKTNQLIRYAKFIIEGLKEIHKQQIAHHDIKPSNFFVDKYDRAKIGDFGIAQRYSDNEFSTKFLGSIPYAAPEVFKGVPFDPFKADIWSLGVSLYQLATGQLPFIGATKNDTVKLIKNGIYYVPNNICQPIRNIISLCLKTDPTMRPTIKEIYEKLSNLSVQPRNSCQFANIVTPMLSPINPTKVVKQRRHAITVLRPLK